MTKDQSGLPPDDFDAEVILERQKAALARFSGEVVQKHLSRLDLAGKASASDLGLYGLVMDLYHRLDLLTGPADIRRTDPLSFYEKNVSPVLQLLQKQQSLNALNAPVMVDLSGDFLGYNWHRPEAAHGFSAWRWMGPGPQSGIMIPAMKDIRVLRLVGRSSVSVQDAELKIRLNGNPLKIISDRKKGGNLHINLEIPADIVTDTQMSTFPWCVLQLEVQTHLPPSEEDPRSRGYGIGSLELIGGAHD